MPDPTNVVRQWIETIWNAGDLDQIDRFHPPVFDWECIPHVPAKLAAKAEKYSAAVLKRDQEQATAAFARYFQPSHDAADRHEVIVCHGNLIRYFVCRTLQVTLDAWVNMDTHNCGMSTIQIQPDGECLLLSFNDVGHLPAHLLTFNAL